MIYMGKARVIERESNLMIFSPYQVWKHCAWLVVDNFISAANVDNCVISSTCLTDGFQVCRGARVIRIVCASIKTLRECLAEVILS